MVSYLIFLKKKFGGKKMRSMKKFKKTEKWSKNVIIFSSNLNLSFGLENVEIWFSLFQKKL